MRIAGDILAAAFHQMQQFPGNSVELSTLATIQKKDFAFTIF